MLDLDLATFGARLATRPPRSIAGDPETARASVAAIFRPAATTPELLFIRRADRAGDPWSGHMAFPGGRTEPSDADALATALRETREELGFDLASSAELLGRLDDIRATSRSKQINLVISPFVFALRSSVDLVPNDEIAEAIWAPIGPLAMGEALTTIDYVHEGETLALPGLRVADRVVWGLTYQMLAALFDALRT